MPDFTPGPWEDDMDYVVDSQHNIICAVESFHRRWEEARANANLIKAAPDMYRALKSWCKGCEEECVHCPNYHAITRAEGK